MSTDGDVLKRISQLEKKVTELYKALGRAEPDFAEGEVSDQVMDLIISGNKMEAMKVYRQQTACELAEANATIERIAAAQG